MFMNLLGGSSNHVTMRLCLRCARTIGPGADDTQIAQLLAVHRSLNPFGINRVTYPLPRLLKRLCDPIQPEITRLEGLELSFNDENLQRQGLTTAVGKCEQVRG